MEGSELMNTDFLNDYDWAGLTEKVVAALVILLVTWVLAKAVTWAFTKLVGRVGFLQRSGSDGQSLGETIGRIASLLIWLFGLIAILQVFALDQVLAPIQSLLSDMLGYLPNLIGAAFVFVIGALIAKVVRELIEATLGTIDFDRLLDRGRSTAGTTTRSASGTRSDTMQTESSSARTAANSIPKTIATVVFALIMIVVTIAALQILGISAISDPAEQMLTIIFDAIPTIIAAALLLALGVVIARFAGGLLEQVLAGLGTDRAVRELGVETEQSASSVLARVAQVAIVLFFAVMAAQLLGFPQISEFLSQVLELGGQVLFGGAIIAVGFFVANLLSRMVNGGTATDIVRYSTIVLFAAMGLSCMGIADNIIELAFGALVVGGALAAAIAFGLGGRDAAARQLARLESRRDRQGPATPETRSDPLS